MVADDLTKKGASVSAAMVLAESSWDILLSALKGVILDMFVIWYRRSIDTSYLYFNPEFYYHVQSFLIWFIYEIYGQKRYWKDVGLI